MALVALPRRPFPACGGGGGAGEPRKAARARRGARLAWLAVVWAALALLPALAHAVARAAIAADGSASAPDPPPAPIPPPMPESKMWTSRFRTSWRRYEETARVANIGEARGRIVYSAVRAAGSDGLGHAMSTINADVSAALQLGVAYSHRVGQHKSLTAADVRAVERFFGWGSGAVPREQLRRACKMGEREWRPDECPVCWGVRGDGRWERGVIERIVELPVNLTYTFYQTFHSEEDRERAVRQFLGANDRPNTLFQMPVKLCSKSPALSFFSNAARKYFHTKYWHARLKDRVYPALNESELNIAIHARRGDFFQVKRPMTKVSAFGVAVREAVDAVLEKGGPFAKMPVTVLLYSEGEPLGSGPLPNHDVSRMSDKFVDADGKLRGSDWVRAEIMGARHDLFKNGLRVEMRIARDTLSSAHEMIAADIFFGSLSGLSTQVVGSLSRAGVVALPIASRPPHHWPGHCPLKQNTGQFQNTTQLREAWSEYADYFAVHAARALYASRQDADGLG